MLISGGDPLTLSDERLDYLLGRLRAIRHVEFVRLGTKVPVVLPMRVTRSLIRDPEEAPSAVDEPALHPSGRADARGDRGLHAARRCRHSARQPDGAAQGHQQRRHAEDLYHGLLKRRVRPYYLYQCDPISGSSHFRTSVDKGLEIMQGLRGHTTGYAVPTYVVDAPGGGGKIPLLPDYVQGRDGDDLILKNFEGKTYRYTDPEGGRSGSDGKRRKPLMRIALVYDLRDDYRALGFSEEEIAEFDNIDTIDQLEGALRASLRGGARRPRAGACRAACRGERFDLVFSIAEGLKGRSREAQVPALCELFDQPYLLSDPLTSAVALDKAVAKRLVRDAGVPTPAFMVAKLGCERACRLERVSGLRQADRGRDRQRLRVGVCGEHIPGACRRTAKLLTRYHQPVLVETYLPGREFTVGIVGNGEDAPCSACARSCSKRMPRPTSTRCTTRSCARSW